MGLWSAASDVAPLLAEDLFACLDRHSVRYVLIGGLAAVLHGSPLPTLDADICPLRTTENLEKLAAALAEIDARVVKILDFGLAKALTLDSARPRGRR